MSELTEKIAREHKDFRYACKCGVEPDDTHARHVAEVTEAAVRAEATVTPSREDVAELVRELIRERGQVVNNWPQDEADAYRDAGGFSPGWEAVEKVRVKNGTDAFLALLPGRSEAEVKAEALREASEAYRGYGTAYAQGWLLDRAARIARGES